MRFGTGVLALLLGLQATPVLAANCTFQPFSTVPGADLALQWTVRSGRPCDVLLRVGNGIGVSRMLVWCSKPRMARPRHPPCPASDTCRGPVSSDATVSSSREPRNPWPAA